MDTGDDHGEWVEYEMPIQIMVNNRVKSSLIHAFSEDTFDIKGITFHLEKQYTQLDPENDFDDTGEPIPINIQIKRIDVIYNPEYEKLITRYRLPVFFKSLPERHPDVTYWKQGFIDNGR